MKTRHGSGHRPTSRPFSRRRPPAIRRAEREGGGWGLLLVGLAGDVRPEARYGWRGGGWCAGP